jgi:uncharacterized protein (TIRG00374 family)
MNKKILSLLQYLFFLGLGLFLLWLTLRKSDWNTIWKDIASSNFIYLIPATLFLLISHFSRALRWKILIEPLGYKPGTANSYLTVLIGYWANLAVPRLGEVLKCTMLSRYEKIPADKLVGTIVAERAIDVITLLVLFFITVVIQYDIIGDFTFSLLSSFFSRTSGELAAGRLILVLLLLFAGLGGLIFLFKKKKENPFVVKVKKVVKGVLQGLTSIRYIKNKTGFIFHTISIWLMYLLSTYMGFFAIQGLSHFNIEVACSVLTFGSFGMIIPSPGGIGSFQYAVQQVMLLYDVSPAKGLSLGMLIWLAQTGIVIIAGTISFMVLPIINKKKK